MAWALQFDGVDDYISLPITNMGANAILELKFSDYVNNPSRMSYLFWWVSYGFRIRVTSSGVFQLYDNSHYTAYLDGEEVVSNVTLMPQDSGVIHTLRLEFVSDRKIRDIMADNNGNDTAKIKLHSLSVSGLFDLDATASDHSAGGQPVLKDTVGGNNATGVNFPTDGSAWVDLGGGGATITADIATTAKKPTVLASSSATLPQPDSVVSITTKKPTVSIASSAEVPQPSAVVSITAKKPSVQASSSATLPQPQASASVTAKKATVSVISSASLPQPTAVVSTTAKKPSVSVSGSASLSQANAVVSITAKKPTVQADSSATLPQPDATLTTSAKKPTVSITGGAVVPYPVSDVTVIAKKPTVNTTGGATLPQPSATVTVIGKKPTVAISATVSGLVLVAPDDAKIKYQPGSNSLTYYPGSNKLAV